MDRQLFWGIKVIRIKRAFSRKKIVLCLVLFSVDKSKLQFIM